MDDVARLNTSDRADLFAAASRSLNLPIAVVEKDFWVCWTLKRLFSLPASPGKLLFKGGTSLSKVFKSIERFSEDVDLSFDRASLGFGGDKDPIAAASGKKKRQGVEAVMEACQRVVRDALYPMLAAEFVEALKVEPSPTTWRLELAQDDPDCQTILFHYPSLAAPGIGEPAYVRPIVRLELGARSDHWPAVDASVMPYAAEAFPQSFGDPKAAVRVLAAERTFWEKATILHKWHHAPADKHFRDRQSRHYYDVVQLWRAGPGQAANQDKELLLKVAEHKEVFFAAAWARYDLARPGTLKLVPPDFRLPELERDYAAMREMIFSKPPTFKELMHELREIEATINRKQA